MDSQVNLVFDVFEKMISGELESSPDIYEILQEEENIGTLRNIISNLDFIHYLVDDPDLKEQKLQERLEVVIDINTRPVIYICNNTFQLDNLAIGKEIPSSIKSALEKAKTENILEKAIKATCKINYREPGHNWEHIGTGWLIAENIIVTNSHVASFFATGDDRKPSFKSGLEVLVDFIAEYNQEDDEDNPKKAKFKVESVIYAHEVKTHYLKPRYPDIAFLQVSDKSVNPGISLPEPISLLENLIREDPYIVVIGYPAAPATSDTEEMRKQGFIEPLEKVKYGRKVLQPGRIITSESSCYSDDKICHDCTTFGGNSGSILIDLKTGKAVGLHFGGNRYEVRKESRANFAVPVQKIQKVAKEIGLDI
jgi:endonuclease G